MAGVGLESQPINRPATTNKPAVTINLPFTVGISSRYERGLIQKHTLGRREIRPIPEKDTILPTLVKKVCKSIDNPMVIRWLANASSEIFFSLHA